MNACDKTTAGETVEYVACDSRTPNGEGLIAAEYNLADWLGRLNREFRLRKEADGEADGDAEFCIR